MHGLHLPTFLMRALRIRCKRTRTTISGTSILRMRKGARVAGAVLRGSGNYESVFSSTVSVGGAWPKGKVRTVEVLLAS